MRLPSGAITAPKRLHSAEMGSVGGFKRKLNDQVGMQGAGRKELGSTRETRRSSARDDAAPAAKGRCLVDKPYRVSEARHRASK